MSLIKQFGLHWPRNAENLEEIEDVARHRTGVYLLYHGAMPVYIGRGAISARLLSHAKEGSRKEQFWDRFSWFVVDNAKRERELESLLLEALPFYVRSLNKQSGKLLRKFEVAAPSREVMDVPLPRPVRRVQAAFWRQRTPGRSVRRRRRRQSRPRWECPALP